jgi:metal-responsive CopG/Arc/MetJ family transcriptional regulator
MPQITLRVSEDLLDRVEERLDPETSRSEWIREAARQRLREDEHTELQRKLDDLERRVEALEAEYERNPVRRLARVLRR